MAWRQHEVFTFAIGYGEAFIPEVGERYLLMANRGHHGYLVADGCGSSLEFGSAKAQLDYLSTLDKPTRGGSVFGTAVLRRELQRPGSGHNTETAWSPVETRMRLTGGRSTRTAMTDGGKFRFDGLPAGTYSLRITVPPTLTEWVGPERSVTLPDTHACAAVGFSFSERPR